MFKRILRLVYIPLIAFFKKLRNYVLPNLFSKANYSFTNNPTFNQRTEFTGIGSIKIGENCRFGYKPGGFHYKGNIELQARTKNASIILGNNISTNNNIFICSSNYISIGNNTLIGQGVVIMDFEAHGVHPDHRRKVGEIGEIKIGENVWIGNNVTILKNSEIGKNCIIATGAVVNKKFPGNVIIGGVPAKIIKNII